MEFLFCLDITWLLLLNTYSRKDTKLRIPQFSKSYSILAMKNMMKQAERLKQNPPIKNNEDTCLITHIHRKEHY